MGRDPARASRNLPPHSQLSRYAGEAASTRPKVVCKGGGSAPLPLRGGPLSGKRQLGAAGDAGGLAAVADRATPRVSGVRRSRTEALGAVVSSSFGVNRPVTRGYTRFSPT